MSLQKKFLLIAKTVVSLYFVYQGLCKVTPDFNPNLFFKIDEAYRGEYGRIIQHFITDTLKLSYVIQPVSLKRSLGNDT